MDLTLEVLLLLIILSIIAAIIATIAGVGGGIMWVPIMTILIGLPIDEAIDTSTFIILISSLTGFITYLKQKRTNLKLSLIFASFSILGGLICVVFLLFFPLNNEVLRILFGVLLVITGLNMFYKVYRDKKKGPVAAALDDNYSLKDHDYKKDLKRGIPFFIVAGFVAYLLGIGGGVIFTPSLNIIFGFPIHNATAISTSIIFFTAISNTIIKVFIGKINYLIGVIMGIGSIIGAVLGAKISKKMPKMFLQVFVAFVLVILGINMLI